MQFPFSQSLPVDLEDLGFKDLPDPASTHYTLAEWVTLVALIWAKLITVMMKAAPFEHLKMAKQFMYIAVYYNDL